MTAVAEPPCSATNFLTAATAWGAAATLGVDAPESLVSTLMGLTIRQGRNRVMRAITVSEFGGPDVLQIGEVPAPEPGPQDLLVATEAIGVNFIDTYFRTGAYAVDLPYVAGAEGSGVVTRVGSEVRGFRVGDRVAWASAPGSYAEQVVVSAAAA